MRLIYLGSPYSHKEEDVRRQRVIDAAEVLAHYATVGKNLCLYSPIVHWSTVAFAHDLPHDLDFWMQQDFHMIRLSTALWVLTSEGWEESFGLNQEIEFAESIGRETFYVIKDSPGFYVTDARPTRTPTTD